MFLSVSQATTFLRLVDIAFQTLPLSIFLSIFLSSHLSISLCISHPLPATQRFSTFSSLSVYWLERNLLNGAGHTLRSITEFQNKQTFQTCKGLEETRIASRNIDAAGRSHLRLVKEDIIDARQRLQVNERLAP